MNQFFSTPVRSAEQRTQGRTRSLHAYRLLAMVGLFAVVATLDASACPSCADNVAAVDEGTARGFAASIIGLIALPLLLVGGIGLAVIRSRQGGAALMVLLCGSLAVVGCGGSEDGEEVEVNRVPADMSAAVIVSGTVEFTGVVPEPERIDVSADEYCGLRHDGGVVLSNEVVVNDGKLANVFVYVSKGLEGYSFDTPSEPAVLDQKGCRYVPHVMGIMIGRTLEIRNSDSTLHNVHSMAKNNKAFNLGQFGGTVDTKVFEKEEVMIPVVCDVHGWMRSWIGVLHHPAFGVSGEDGSYSFTAPPGDYTVTAWHERFGTRTGQLTIEAGTPATLNFSFE